MSRHLRATLGLSFLLAGAVPPWHDAAAQSGRVATAPSVVADQSPAPVGKTALPIMPSIVRPSESRSPTGGEPRTIQAPSRAGASGETTGRSGTGFFVDADGSLLTAAHVAQDCARIQVVSQYIPRTWASVVAADPENDIALLRTTDLKPPAVVSIGTTPPLPGKLYILGYPASAGLTVPSEAWGELENQKFPDAVRALANPRDLLWMSAPAVTHGYSGGPVFDPRSGAVVGLVKGTVGGGYLRLIRGVPTTGVAIGPGIAHIAAAMRRASPYSLVRVNAGGDGIETVRRATVHVLCWQ